MVLSKSSCTTYPCWTKGKRGQSLSPPSLCNKTTDRFIRKYREPPHDHPCTSFSTGGGRPLQQFRYLLIKIPDLRRILHDVVAAVDKIDDRERLCRSSICLADARVVIDVDPGETGHLLLPEVCVVVQRIAENKKRWSKFKMC